MTGDSGLLLIILLPLAGALAIAVAGRIADNLREAVTLGCAGLLAALVWQRLPAVLDGARPALRFGELLPGVELVLALEPLGMLFAGLASALWIVNSVYSIGYMRGNAEHHQTRFYAFFAIAIGGAMGVALAGNLVTLFLCYEVLTLSTWPLVAHKGDGVTLRSARVYLGVLLATSIGLLLPAILWTWRLAGTLDFVPGGFLDGRIAGPAAGALLGLYLFGIGKAALMPVHRWLPAAMVAPTPVSALLHAVAVVKAGVFTVLKVLVYVFGFDFLRATPATDWVVYVAAFSVIAASVIALRQTGIKRLLAYSTVAQLGYVVMAGALLVPAAGLGAAIHMAAHACGKITLFFAAGAFYTAAKKTLLTQLDGVGRRMPWTAAAFTLGALSMVGVPPTAGFISKWYILGGALAAGSAVAVLTILASALLNAAYFLPIVYRLWFAAPAEDGPTHGEAPWPMVLAMVVTALLTLGFAVFAAPLVALLTPVMGAYK